MFENQDKGSSDIMTWTHDTNHHSAYELNFSRTQYEISLNTKYVKFIVKIVGVAVFSCAWTYFALVPIQ